MSRNYNVNKGVGRPIELKGLRAQYLFIFAGGLAGVFILYLGMYISGIPNSVCLPVAVVSATLLVWATFRLNARYGAHGLMKALAARRYPRRIVHRKRIPRLLNLSTRKTSEHEK